EIIKNVEINDTINYQANLSLSALNYRNTVKPDDTYEGVSRELMRIVDREVKLDCLRRVVVKLVGQNYFTFGKGHTDEQDKAFIADFMAFAGKDSTMAKTMIDEYYERKKSEEQTASGKTAPDITMETIDGKQVQLASLLKGKFTYIDVWATWCGPCCAEIPHLEKLVEKYKDNDKVQFISISVDTNRQAWENKLKKDNPQWQQYLLTPENNKIFSADWGITGIPRFIMIDANGNVYNANASRPSNKETEETIDKIIR
ncbi:MAG: TlpA family protein disulfide reductase, partial [Prevotella sp.]